MPFLDANREQIAADKMIAVKELRKITSLRKIREVVGRNGSNVTCNEQAMLLWDSVPENVA